MYKSEVYKNIDEKFNMANAGEPVEFTGDELAVLSRVFRLGIMGMHDLQDSGSADNKERLELIEHFESEEGFCYGSLIRTLPSLGSGNLKHFRDSIVEFRLGLSEFPLGTDILVNLCILDKVLSGDLPLAVLVRNRNITEDERVAMNLLEDSQHIRTISKMSGSKHRFNYQDGSGIVHLEYRGVCECEDILCHHGWATRFILQVVAREGRKIGGNPNDIDLSQLFVSQPDDCLPSSVQQTPLSACSGTKPWQELRNSPPVQPLAQHPSGTTDSLRQQISEDLVRMLGEQLNARTDVLEETMARILEQKRGEALKSSRTDSSDYSYVSGSDLGSDVESTLHPLDSSSTAERYGKRYMIPGTVYRVNKGKTVLEPLAEARALDVTPDVANGFQMTESMSAVDREVRSSVYSINGLAAPFKKPRLNFLMHFHTALGTCGVNPQTDPLEALEEIAEMKPDNPTEELIKQCVNKTFDFETLSVKSNPFKLPMIEVGMLITHSMLMKCLDLLYNEYKMSWFEEMKCLVVPQFHSEFHKYSTRIDTKGRSNGLHRRREVKKAQSDEKHSIQQESRRGRARKDSGSSKQRSILGFPL